MPMGLLNWWRVFAYSVEVSSTFCAPPIISAHSAAVAHSSARFNAGHALCGAPISESAVSSTPSKRTSFQRRVISRVCSWCSDMPLRLHQLQTLDMTRRWNEVRFDGVELTADSLMGAPHKAWPALKRALEWATAALCAEMIGGAQKVLETSTEYAKTRH